MGDLVLKGATSGQITLSPVGTAGTNTLTLPAKTGNIITSADTGTVTQTMLGTNVAGNGPAFSAYYNGSSVNVSATTATKIQVNTVDFNVNPSGVGCYNNTGSTATLNGLSVPAYSFMPNVAGYYQINASLTGAQTASSNSNVSLLIYKNGSIFRGATSASISGNFIELGLSALISMNGSTDYLELWIYGSAAITYYGAAQAPSNYNNTLMSGFLARSA